MYKIKVSDFVEIEQNLSSFTVEDMVHICKRKNNTKREYLFVNRFQGKHIPENPDKIITLYNEFYNAIENRISSDKYAGEKIVVVGFAETATALGEFVAYSMSNSEKLKDNFVYYLQTSREDYDCPKLFNFAEEHSHAVNQCLYCKGGFPAFDRVIFIEDEITTGKTIINFIENFKKLNKDCKYSVASLLNWQNDESISTYRDMDIDRIFLVSGKLKDNVPKIDIKDNEVDNLFDKTYYDAPNSVVVPCNTDICNARLGVSSVNCGNRQFKNINEVVCKLADILSENDKVMVVGTEEFMFYPLMIAKGLKDISEVGVCSEVAFRATTRSPITPNNEDGYIIKDGISLPSAYDCTRKTFLYNLNGDYNKMIVITENGYSNEFVNALENYCRANDKCLEIVSLGVKCDE